MTPLFRISARRPWLVLLAFVSALVVSLTGLDRLSYEDDVLVFLPQDDPDVIAFREVSARFGSLRVALVGVEVEGGDVLDAEHLPRIQAASQALALAPGVTRVTSIATVTDVTIGDAGVVVEPLISAAPTTAIEHQRLRERVLSRELVVGQLITPDARAAALLVYFRADVSTGEIVERVEAVVGAELGAFEVFLTGAPFAAEAIYGEARRDVARLSPLAAAVLIVVILLSFRDVVGVLLTFATVAFGVVVTLGAMGWVGERATLLTSTLPILLLATGSSYAVHVLGRYYLERETADPQLALERGGAIVSRPVAIAAWTTIAAFASFLVMDVRPMRTFGLEVALGTLTCWLTALTLIPAVLTLVPRAPVREQLLPFGGALWWVWGVVRRHRRSTLIGLAVVTLAAAAPMGEIAVKTEASAFLREGSATWLANDFFDRRFGGARFVQVEVRGDFSEPSHLREVARLVDRATAIPGVTQVTSFLDPLALTTDLLGGGRRLPSTRAQADKAYLFLDGEADFVPLLGPDHRHALIQIRIQGEAEGVIAELQRFIAEDLRPVPVAAPRADAIERLRWLAGAYGADVPTEALARVVDQVGEPPPVGRQQELVASVVAGEDFAELSAAARRALATALVAGSDAPSALVAAGESSDDAQFYAELGSQRVKDRLRTFQVAQGVAAICQAFGTDDPALRHRLSSLLSDLRIPDIAPSTGSLAARVTGEPVLDQALSRSVARNQGRTMVVGLVVVSVLLVILFTRVSLAAICVIPAVVTAVWIGGVMGLGDVRIDLSTAMCGAILTDTASDFGMHYLWYLQRDRAENVVRTVGPVLLVSNLLVALGFFAFALGDSPVMELFGSLSAATCVVSGLVAVVLVPALWRPGWRRPSGEVSAADPNATRTLPTGS